MSEAEAPSKLRKPLFLSVYGGLVVLVLLALPFLVGKPGEKELPDWVRFAGRFHPVLLHLPIGVFMLILVQEAGRILRFKRPGSDGDTMFPLFFGVVSAILAVLAGLLLYHGHAEDYAGQELAERHLWSGLVFAAMSVVVFVMKAWAVAAGSSGWWYRGLLFTCVGVMGFASHDGASMTHGEDYLTRYAPDSLRQIIGLEPKPEKKGKEEGGAADLVVYTDIVAPILERRCVQCHKPGKVKGKLRMDTYEMLLKGGSEGPALVPGDVEESLMLVRIQLPEDDDEHMPPEGKTDLSADELAVLKWWVGSGADPAKKLSEHEVPEEIAGKLAALGAAVGRGEEKGASHGAVAAQGPDAELVKRVADLAKQFPGAVAFESQSSPGVTFTAVSMRGKFDDAEFEKLAAVVPHLVTADFSATKITDQSVAALKSAGKLRQLRLAETAVTDAAVEIISALPALESLNLYGTVVTDAGVGKLKGMKTLKNLYLWQTSVSPEMVEKLRKELPECQIVTGAGA